MPAHSASKPRVNALAAAGIHVWMAPNSDLPELRTIECRKSDKSELRTIECRKSGQRDLR
jgi:hypothetical protein